jgi:CDP-diacylglycerol--serine O-phosphatidyltransferase
MRRAVVVVPSALTLGNLFFGIWAIVTASRGDFRLAAWLVMISGVLDMLDGRVARISGAGTRFGAELDSLVDCIAFGVAPAMIMYFLEFASPGNFAWMLCFGYVAMAAMRLARFNVMHDQPQQPGWFTGLPSPAAGMTLATFYPFSQTPWYQTQVAVLNLQRQGLVVLMALLAVLMVSHIKYPKFPPIGFRSVKGIFGLLVHLIILVCGLAWPSYFFFPLGITYAAFGVLRTFVVARNDRPEWVPDISEDDRITGAHPRYTAPRRALPEERHKETEG